MLQFDKKMANGSRSGAITYASMAEGPKFRHCPKRVSEEAPQVFHCRNSLRLKMEKTLAEKTSAAPSSGQSKDLMGAEILVKALQAENLNKLLKFRAFTSPYNII